MPNHVVNRITVHTTAARLRPLCAGANGDVDFSVLLPEPINFWLGSYHADHVDAFPGVGMVWRRENWGTKWNAYDSPSFDASGAWPVLKFQTAWSPPRGWVVALFNTLGCKIEHLWLDEGREKAYRDSYDPTGGFDGYRSWRCDPADEAAQLEMEVQLYGRPFAEIHAERSDD